MAGHVRAGWVDHLAEIREGDQRRKAGGVVLVECGPAAVAALHRQHPAKGALAELRIDRARFQQSEQDHGGIVDVGIEIVLELERPSAGFHALDLHAPVAGNADLLPQKPPGGPLHHRSGRIDARLEQREERESRIPDRGQTRLHPHPPVRVAKHPAVVHALETLPQRGVVEWMAERAQRHQRIHPRRLDPSPASVRLLVGEDPLFGRLAGALAERVERQAAVAAQGGVDRAEEPVDGVARRPWRCLRNAQLV